LQHLLDVVRMAQLVRDPDPAVADHVTVGQGSSKEASQRVFTKLWQIQKKLKYGRAGSFTELARANQYS